MVDGDAYGLDILSVYKHGSFAMRHESERLAAGRIEWVGIWASELTRCVPPSDSFSGAIMTRVASSLGVDRDAMIPITPYDEKKVRIT